MILYFDSYITDKPLHQGWQKLRKIERKVRDGCQTYRTQSRLDITKYTLASYAQIDWTNVLIRYELEDPLQTKEFDRYILSLFPKAIIMHTRSDSQKDYQKSIELLQKLGDEWIFCSPNNDHPFIDVDKDVFIPLIKKANSLKEKYNNNISIAYSHFPEVNCSSQTGHLMNLSYCSNTKIIDEDKNCRSVLYPNGNLDSIQILHIDLLRNWFFSDDCGEARIIRPENLAPHIKPPVQVVIVPKHEIIRHYDGYMHTIYGGSLVFIPAEKVPPLFIPHGFFSKKIKIAYGYDEYRDGWVNINPKKEHYSFEDNIYGTDMKCTIEEIPLFWKDHIKKIDINQKADLLQLERSNIKNKELLSDPWRNIPHFKVQVFFFFSWYRKTIAILGKLILALKDKKKFSYYLNRVIYRVLNKRF